MPRILFCSLRPFRREWGAPKIMMEAGEELSRLGWETVFAGPDEMGVSGDPLRSSEGLRDFLKREAGKYDVVEYEHDQLPFQREEFHRQTVMVARVSLLSLHFLRIPIPTIDTWKKRLRLWISRSIKTSPTFFEEIAEKASRTMGEADLINVANDWDERTIIESGLRGKRIVVIPYGLTRERIPVLESIAERKEFPQRIAFIGTFDRRKGATDMPKILSGISKEFPEMQYRLMGTEGEYRGKESVLGFFPSSIRSKIEVIPQYQSEVLPDLLRDCSVGIFPSYVESFGFAVLEMLAAGMPVVAYRSPGPHSIVREEDLVRPGGREEMIERVVQYFRENCLLREGSEAGRRRAKDFAWQKAGERTDQIYRDAMKEKIK